MTSTPVQVISHDYNSSVLFNFGLIHSEKGFKKKKKDDFPGQRLEKGKKV